MKALIFQEPNQPIVKDIAEPKLEATEVLVRFKRPPRPVDIVSRHRVQTYRPISAVLVLTHSGTSVE